MDSLKALIELSEFGNLASNNPNTWIHKDPITYNSSSVVKTGVDSLIDLLEKYSNQSIKRISNPEQGLPPSSIHSFLRQNLSIPSVLIADHEMEYKNHFYRSIYDKKENLKLEWPKNISEEEAVKTSLTLAINIQKQATSISKVLYSWLTDNKTELNEEADIKLINNLIYCYMYNASCMFFNSTIPENSDYNFYEKLANNNPSNLLSFYTTVSDNMITGVYITNLIFKYVTRERLADNFNKSECKLSSGSVKDLIKSQNRFYNEAYLMKSSNYYTNESLCILSWVFINSSISPALTNHLNGVIKDTADFYPTWTESTWDTPNPIKLFLLPTKTIESVTLAIGICIFIISFVFTFLANKYLSRWLLEGEEVESLNNNNY